MVAARGLATPPALACTPSLSESAMARTAITLEEQLLDLQRRFQLLEGVCKATNGTEQLGIVQNKEVIAQMKAENKDLRQQIAELRNPKPLSAEKQLEDAMAEVHASQRRVDMLRAGSTKRRAYLGELDCRLNELSLNARLPATEASPQMRQIRVLENRFDKAMTKYYGAQSIRETYEAIVKRLREERIGFDNQLAAIEQTLKQKEREYEELPVLTPTRTRRRTRHGDGGSNMNDLWAYSIEHNFWYQHEPASGGQLPAARGDHTAVFSAAEATMLVFGGGTAIANGTYFNDLWAYDTVKMTWAELSLGGTQPAARIYMLDAVGTLQKAFRRGGVFVASFVDEEEDAY
eukprot:NODE_375_length_1619_cov_268.083760.p1 GENE.NODE_375_length_1619_cov_268.083760~~NODE_375_length_1619_cov_268.083760.p1  ORF type:complete len:366 (-),score=109.48 NODE_375_length_1619_cov_268.083760:505-1548(-)